MSVTDNELSNRFEVAEDGDIAFATYEREGDEIIFTHTIVPPGIQGSGVGTRLVAAALAQARAEGLRIVTECQFVAAYIARHGMPDPASRAAR